ncbi:MAG: zf-HC2 domain-containing protein [Candidatus Eisenbacteria bacterium]|nr:zf-HC2 domain-containing protein [Candidatus Eisenbacteria bacterium]
MKPLHPFEDWQLSAHAAGDLEPREAAEVASHLAGCAECRTRQAEMARVGEELHSLPGLQPSRDLWPAISARLAGPAVAGARVTPALARATAPAPMAPCRQQLEAWRLSSYLDGDLDASHRAAVEAHLAGCAACRERAADLQGMVAALRELPAPEPSPFLWARVQAGLREGRPRRSGLAAFEWQRWIPAGAAAAAAFAFVLWSGQARWWDSPGEIAGTASHSASGTFPGGRDGTAPSGSAFEPASTSAGIMDAAPAGPSARVELPASERYTRAAQAWIEGLTRSARPRRAVTATNASTVPGAAMDDASLGPDPDPEITEAIRAHLEQLDANIRDTQTSLALNPGNERVRAAAWAAYMAKVEYLRSILTRQAGGSAAKPSTALPASSVPEAA